MNPVSSPRSGRHRLVVDRAREPELDGGAALGCVIVCLLALHHRLFCLLLLGLVLLGLVLGLVFAFVILVFLCPRYHLLIHTILVFVGHKVVCGFATGTVEVKWCHSKVICVWCVWERAANCGAQA